MKNRIRTEEQLRKYLSLLPEEEEGIRKTRGLYPLAITPYYLSLIDPEDPNDPIRLQAIPRAAEVDEEIQSLGEENPFREEEEIPGLTHRYPDRVLFNTTTLCAVYCRHCMRKRIFSAGERARTREEIDRMLDYVRKHEEVREVILSGGDPLTLSLEKLEYILSSLRRIEHVEVIRVATRLPVLAPQRFFDEKLLGLLERYSPLWLVTHFNHPNEVTEYSEEAVDRVLRRGIPVLNQTVLLKGVNDNPETMLKLFRKLVRIKVKPQYLFHCDPVKGAIHFRTSVDRGLEIMRYLRGRISGYAIPTYAVDLPGGKGKVPLLPNYVKKREENRFIFESFNGELVEYEITEVQSSSRSSSPSTV